MAIGPLCYLSVHSIGEYQYSYPSSWRMICSFIQLLFSRLNKKKHRKKVNNRSYFFLNIWIPIGTKRIALLLTLSFPSPSSLSPPPSRLLLPSEKEEEHKRMQRWGIVVLLFAMIMLLFTLSAVLCLSCTVSYCVVV
ncbi:MAG: hypothetical protein JOS17DRAFT_115347 [Linnemannia elongata]|nr:MAG: hypothetical protein JOS17DRAFT_115347 [Linnemannia elongata]